VAEGEGARDGLVEDKAEGTGEAAAAVIGGLAAESLVLDRTQGGAGGAAAPGLRAEGERAVGVGERLDVEDTGVRVAALEPAEHFFLQVLQGEMVGLAQTFGGLAVPAARLGEAGAEVGGGGDPCAGRAENSGKEFRQRTEAQQHKADGVAAVLGGGGESMQRVECLEFVEGESLIGGNGKVVEAAIAVFVGEEVVGVAVVVSAACAGAVLSGEDGREGHGQLAGAEAFVVEGRAVKAPGGLACVRSDKAATNLLRQRECERGERQSCGVEGEAGDLHALPPEVGRHTRGAGT